MPDAHHLGHVAHGRVACHSLARHYGYQQVLQPAAARALELNAVLLLVDGVRDDGDVVLAGVESAEAGTGADDADYGEGMVVDPDRLAQRIDIRKEPLVRPLPQDDYAAPVAHFALGEEAAGVERQAEDIRIVVHGADNSQGKRLLPIVRDARPDRPRAPLAYRDGDAADRLGRLALDGAGVGRRQCRPIQQRLELGAGHHAQAGELRHEDRVRSQLADAVAQRRVEAEDERRHPDHRGDADDDPENREPGSHLLGPYRAGRHDDDLVEERGAHRLSLVAGPAVSRSGRARRSGPARRRARRDISRRRAPPCRPA